MRMLFDYYETERLVVCMDPNNMDLLRDFFSDRSQTKLLEVESNFTDEYLLGHAMRVGLAGENTPQETIDRLLPTIRADVTSEGDAIRDAGFDGYLRISEFGTFEANTRALARFLSIPEDRAKDIAETDQLFSD